MNVLFMTSQVVRGFWLVGSISREAAFVIIGTPLQAFCFRDQRSASEVHRGFNAGIKNLQIMEKRIELEKRGNSPDKVSCFENF